MTKGKIVLIPFPFDDLSAAKVRPAVCLTDPIGFQRHVILAFITSQKVPDPLGSDVWINSISTDFGVTGLRVSSTLRLHRLMTITTTLILRELGALPPALQQETNRKLAELFGIPDHGTC